MKKRLLGRSGLCLSMVFGIAVPTMTPRRTPSSVQSLGPA